MSQTKHMKKNHFALCVCGGGGGSGSLALCLCSLANVHRALELEMGLRARLSHPFLRSHCRSELYRVTYAQTVPLSLSFFS